MIDAINAIYLSPLQKGLIFFLTAFGVMIYYSLENYVKQYRVQSINYWLLKSNPQKTYKCVKRLLGVTVGASAFSVLDQSSNVEVLSFAAAIGWTAYSGEDK